MEQILNFILVILTTELVIYSERLIVTQGRVLFGEPQRVHSGQRQNCPATSTDCCAVIGMNADPHSRIQQRDEAPGGCFMEPGTSQYLFSLAAVSVRRQSHN